MILGRWDVFLVRIYLRIWRKTRWVSRMWYRQKNFQIYSLGWNIAVWKFNILSKDFEKCEWPYTLGLHFTHLLPSKLLKINLVLILRDFTVLGVLAHMRAIKVYWFNLVWAAKTKLKKSHRRPLKLRYFYSKTTQK